MKPLTVLLAIPLAAAAVAAAGCAARAPPPRPVPNAAGLVPLPCDENGVLRPLDSRYCTEAHNYVVPGGYDALAETAVQLATDHAGARLRYMEASWPSGQKSMPVISHGDGRQVDLALFYQTTHGVRLKGPPATARKTGYGAYEPPRTEAERACPAGLRGDKERPDPPADRDWKLDETRTAAMIRLLIADPHVRQVTIEPHLKARLGFANAPKVAFAGCEFTRQDDHLHVDFF